MKTKTIKQVIRKKIDQLLASVDDEVVKSLMANNIIVTGGCIASMLLKEKVNDFDIYFKSREAAVAAAFYYAKRFDPKNKKGIEVKIVVANGLGHPLKEEDYKYIPLSAADETPDAPLAPKPQDALPVFDLGDDDPPSTKIKKPVEIPLIERVKIYIKSAGVASEEGTENSYEYFESSTQGRAGAYLDDVMGASTDSADEAELTTAAEVLDKGDEIAAGLVKDSQPPYRPIFMSSNAITLSNHVQIVLRFFGQPDEIHANYDFAHCTNYWTSWDNKLVLRADALECLLTRELRYFGSRYPICSLIRVRKFVARGWTINAGQILKMVFQVGDLNLKDPKVLEDQLTGVDVAYFAELIAKIKANDPEKINSAYLIEIIDRLF
jgi:hypothetical protein